MRLKAEQLRQHLTGVLSPVYFICGDEPLLAQEAADAIRTAARAQGFTERELFHANASFDWQSLLSEANAMSLFADKKILELRIETGKPGDKGSKAIVEYCEAPAPDNLLLVITPKLDASAMRSKWVKSLEAVGVLIQVWPVDANRMPQWISGRLQQANIRASRGAVEILADRVEGNLLAAVQEIEKLRLLAIDSEIDAKTMSTVVADSARFNVFSLIDKVLEGDAPSAARTLRGLKDEGSEPLVILWALTRELRILVQAAEARQYGKSSDDILKDHRIWDNRKPMFKTALRRLKPPHLRALLRQAGLVDRASKGMAIESPWEVLTALTMSFAGTPTLSAKSVKLAVNQ